MNNIDYKIIVTKDYLDDILMHSIDFFSFIHEGTMRGEPDKINGLDVEYRGSIFVGDMNIGIYLLKKEVDLYMKKCKQFDEKIWKKWKKLKESGSTIKYTEFKLKELEKLNKK